VKSRQIYSFIASHRTGSEVYRLTKDNETSRRIIEQNSTISQSYQLEVQELNEKVSDGKDDKISLLREIDDVKRERDRIEDWIMSRSTNALPSFFTYSGTNTVLVTNFLAATVVHNRTLTPDMPQTVKSMFGSITKDTITIYSQQGDTETYGLAAQLKDVFVDIGYTIGQINPISWREPQHGIIISSRNSIMASKFGAIVSKMNEELNTHTVFDIETNMNENQISIYVCSQ
jgi:hypothetical protein